MGKTLSLGINLRAARKQKGWNIPSLSKELCISKSYLRALECDDKAALPTATFAVGFFRSYATHLGLDVNNLVKTAKNFYHQPYVSNDFSTPEAPEESRVPTRPLILTLACSLIGLYSIWLMFPGGGELKAELTPPVPDHLSNLIADEYSNPSGLVNKVEIGKPEITRTGTIPSGISEITSINSIDVIKTDANQSISETVLSNNLKKNQFKSGLEIKADKNTWVLIKTAENKILMEGILKSGKSLLYLNENELFITTSDAGAIKIIVDGKASDSIGKSGVVLKDASLSKYSEKSNSLTSSH
ncbi:MAG: helix-turn-helix domain-containing protein [Sphingomonadales bacterium]